MDALSRNHRHLLLFAPTTTNPELILARQEIDRNRDGVNDRDLLVHELIADESGPGESPGAARSTGTAAGGVSAAESHRRYGVDPARFCMILVGKDGGEKRRDDRAVPMEDIFALIDTMPMRRREMRDRH